MRAGGCVTARLRIVVADDERPAALSWWLFCGHSMMWLVSEAASGKKAVAMIEKEAGSCLARLADAGARRHRRRSGAGSDLPLIAFVTA
jgi:hypothetical protein